MQKRILRTCVLIFAILVSDMTLVFAWGAWGHQHINRAAVFALPVQMRRFFYDHIDFITEEAVVPDLRKYTINDKAEGPRHYINLEAFGTRSMDSLPADPQLLKEKYSDTLLQKAGILPWYLLQMEEKLTKAFKAKRKTEILFLAADLAHYIGDANMPLHTSLNHDGQLTDQKGVHAFFEGQLPELFGQRYNLCTGAARYIGDLKKETWSMIQASFQKADTLLTVEKLLKASFQADKIYQLDSAGQVVKNKFTDPVHTHAYAKAYHDALHGMVERQLRQAIAETSSYWYTAWINAGKPDLDDLDPAALRLRNEQNYKKDYALWLQGKVSGFKPDAEFSK